MNSGHVDGSRGSIAHSVHFNVPLMVVIGTPSPTILIRSLGIDSLVYCLLASGEAQKAQEFMDCGMALRFICLQVAVAWILPKVH